MDINVLIALCLLAVILSSITAIFSVLAYSKVVGMEKSTHQIQWMPVDQPNQEVIQPESEVDSRKYEEQMYKDFRKIYPDIHSEQV